MHALRNATLAALLLAAGCARLTSRPVGAPVLGVARTDRDLLEVVDRPGPVELETIIAADWAAPRDGLWNLDDERTRTAGLAKGVEPIQIRFQVLRHPTHGTFLIDNGVERALRDRPKEAAVRGVVADQLGLAALKIRLTTADWLQGRAEPVRGVFQTHLHPDHVLGLADLPAGTPVYVGPGEAEGRAFINLFLQSNMDRAFAGRPLVALPFGSTTAKDALFDGIVDVFGDGTVWALHVPGHTAASTAYLVRTPKGSVLVTGDACHTRAMWDRDLEAGSFSADRRGHARSLARLRKLVSEHPTVEVSLAHQP